MRIACGERSDPGLVRPNNQDAYANERLASPQPTTFLMVADGMGGYEGGEVASRLAVDTIKAMMAAEAPRWAAPADAGQTLLDAIHEANHAILEAQVSHPDLANMGTTVTAVVIWGGRLVVGHVGDSKAYLVGPQRAMQITSDHNVPGELLQSGHLTAAQAAVHPQRHVLTRALGVQEELAVERLDLEWRPGDLLLLCTDGLSNLVPLTEIQVLAGEMEPAALVDRLVELANQRGGHDNITVLAARWEG